MRDAEIKEIATRVLSARFAAQRLLACGVASEIDFDGEPVVRVTATVKEPINDILYKVDTALALKDELYEAGERRFVFLDVAEDGRPAAPSIDDEDEF